MQRVVRKVIDSVILTMFLLVFVGTLISTNVNGQVLGVIVAIAVVLLYVAYLLRHHWSWFTKIRIGMRSSKFKPKWLLALVTLVYQIILVYGLAGETGFDTGIVKWAAQSKPIEDYTYLYNYFSHNPNNLGIMFAERGIYHLTKFFGLANFTIVLDLINLALVDIAIILVMIVLKKHLKRPIIWSIFPLVVLISPWIVIVYTDTVILPFVAGIVFLMDLLINQYRQQRPLTKMIVPSIMLGIVSWAAYVLKPSTAIIGIAFMIELLVYLMGKRFKVDYSKMGLVMVLTLCTFGVLQVGNQTFLQRQNFVHLDKNLKELPSHYIMMGMNRETTGGYSQSDFLYSTNQPTQAKQQKANLKMISKRLDQFGPLGYLEFLVVKNYSNTSDGTLGWLNEGDFFSKPAIDPHPFIRSVFYPRGSRLTIYKTVAQLIWIGTIIGVVLSFLDATILTRILRMSLFGLLVFLLFFEGGRSRYMIQFLPITYILAVIGWSRLKDRVRQAKIIKIDKTKLFGSRKSTKWGETDWQTRVRMC